VAPHLEGEAAFHRGRAAAGAAAVQWDRRLERVDTLRVAADTPTEAKQSLFRLNL
jgi:hypothetical protein